MPRKSSPKTRHRWPGFWSALAAELPAFVLELWADYEMPSRTVRPADHLKLWNLMHRSQVVFRRRTALLDNDAWMDIESWTGTASALRLLLISPESHLTEAEKHALISDYWISRALKRGAEVWGEKTVKYHRNQKARYWTVARTM